MKIKTKNKMKNLKYILSLFLIITAFVACEQEDDLPDVSVLPAPTNVAAVVSIAQDISGVVTITPTGENVANFRVNYGDGSGTNSGLLNPGESTQNTYLEGTYEIVIAAYGINGKTTTIAQTIVVSFQAPENLVVTLENDAAVSKQVNVTVTADYAVSYEVDFGDPAGTVIMSNINDVTSFTYTNPGTYTITVTAFSGSVDTISYSENFIVTEILAPLVAAPTPPSRNVADVVSIFSDAYTNVTLDELPTSWSVTSFATATVASDNTWKLSSLDFLGMVTNYATGIDLSSMEKMHIDYWVPSGTTNELSVKIVNTIDGGEAEQSLGTTVSGSWQSIELDVTGFDGGTLANKNKITQLLIVADGVAGVVYIDNFYFYKAPSTGTAPTVAAPVPTQAQANVINMYSNVYTQDVNVSSWRSGWSTSTLTDIQVAGNDTKEYIDADFVGVEFYGTDAVDATTMDFFHVDVWTSNADTFRVKLVDLGGASGTEAEIEFTSFTQGSWVSLDIPMADFIAGGMTATNSIQQLIFSGLPTGTFDFYIDNVYFYQGTPAAPTTAAPDPTELQANVINMYSNMYTQDVNISSWRSSWSTSTLTDIQIAGNDTKEYIDADFVGVEFYGADAVDASSMAFFHVDVWTPNADTFRVKLVDLGSATGTEAEIEFTSFTQGSWVSLDIPMADFIAGGMTATNSIQQLIFSGLPTGSFDFYIDNVYFHN